MQNEQNLPQLIGWRLLRLLSVVLVGGLWLSGCQAEENNRWYSEKQVTLGQQVFAQNCAACHGANAEATPNWKQTDANGHYPPPPLNGTAHAWHHSLPVLREQINQGGAPVGGVMPAFKGVLSDAEIDQTIAYFQSKWPDDLYQRWAEHFEVEDLPSISGD